MFSIARWRRNAHWSARDVAAAVASLVVAASCGGDDQCIVIPGCLHYVAVSISITSAATHAPVNGVTMQINGGMIETPPCNGRCDIIGSAGKYVISFAAPGFQSTERTVTVTAGSPRVVDVSGPNGFEGKSCGCPTVNPQSIDVALVPTP